MALRRILERNLVNIVLFGLLHQCCLSSLPPYRVQDVFNFVLISYTRLHNGSFASFMITKETSLSEFELTFM